MADEKKTRLDPRALKELRLEAPFAELEPALRREAGPRSLMPPGRRISGLTAGAARPSPAAPQPPAAAPLPAVPAAPPANPFDDLAFPDPGDRIRSDDFKALSRSLAVIRDAFALSGSLLGQSFGDAKRILAGQQYVIQRVMTVFGTEIARLDDPALDQRQVIQVLPLELGEPQVAVIVTEAVDSQRVMPNLLGMSYNDAQAELRKVLAGATLPTTAVAAPDLVGRSLAEAEEIVRQG